MIKPEKLRDKFWLWGHTAGSHDKGWGFDKKSRMTPAESAYYLGIKKVFMVCYANKPEPPFDQDAMALDSMNEVVWSIVGDASSSANIETYGHLDEILRIAGKFPNTTGAIFDDFFSQNENREALYTPEVLRHIRGKLHEKNLDMWTVLYDTNLDKPITEHLAEFDGVGYCTWLGDDLPKFDEDFRKARELAKGKRLIVGCYLYNYGQFREFKAADMEMQLEKFAGLIREGVSEGITLCSNCVADLGFEAVEYTKQWLKEHGDELI